GGLADRLADRTVIPYAQIPHFPRPTVEGHAGNLVCGVAHGTPVMILQGRFHYYEGHDIDAVTFPIRVLQRLGVRRLTLAAATGGINPAFRPGRLVALVDHLNLIGVNPLRGPNEARFGVRFPDMTAVYSAALRDIASNEATKLGIDLATGVY